MADKVYSGIDSLPRGDASCNITPGCAVLEGGAFRGVYGEGVLDALMEADINLECTVGVSAGAMNGVNYVAGQIGRSGRINLRYRHDSRYISYRNYFKCGAVIDIDFVTRNLPDDPFNEERFYSPMQRFFVVATNCLSGKPTYFDKATCTDILRAVRASASMPYISKMVDIDGIPYLDGGCSTKIPYQWALDQGFSKIVIVRSRTEDWRRPNEKEGKLPYRFYRKYPQLAQSIAESDRAYNIACDTIDTLKQQDRVFVISPSEDLGIGRLEKDMEKLGAQYYLGYHDGQKIMPQLQEYLQP